MRWVIDTGDSSASPLAEHGGDAGGVVGVHEVGERAPEQLLGLEPEQVAAGGRRVAHRAGRLEHADQVGRGLREHARARLGLEPRELGAVALGAADRRSGRARRARAASTATRRRRSGSSAARRPAAWRARAPGAPRAARRRRSTRGRRGGRGAAAGCAGRRAARRSATTATRALFGRCAATAARTSSRGEADQERAGDAGAPPRAPAPRRRCSAGEPPTAGRIWVARVSPLRIAPCSAARPADCWTASRVGSALAARARVDDREAPGAPGGVVGAGARRRAAAGAAGERDGGQRALAEQPRGERVELRAPHRQRALHGRGDVGQAVDRPDVAWRMSFSAIASSRA